MDISGNSAMIRASDLPNIEELALILYADWFRVGVMKRNEFITHITDDMGNDVVEPLELGPEFAALCAVADAADEEHRAHCLRLTSNCPICKALAELDQVRQGQLKLTRN